jgi:alpha-L-fucosidase 2
MDLALIRALFANCLDAAETLGMTDDPVCREIRSALPRLRPTALSRDGRLREWGDDHPEHDRLHRHMSPLIALYPLDQIDVEHTPDLAAAAIRTLDAKGPGAFGWTWAWKIALRARLGDDRAARELLREATRPYTRDPGTPGPVNPDPFDRAQWGGLLPNLFSAGPPFQIDGNYGLTAAILELVVQSHGGVIRILPAIPETWPDGAVHGVRCRGGWSVDFAWQAGAIVWLTVRNMRPAGTGTARIRYGDRTAVLSIGDGEDVRLGPDLTELSRTTP